MLVRSVKTFFSNKKRKQQISKCLKMSFHQFYFLFLCFKFACIVWKMRIRHRSTNGVLSDCLCICFHFDSFSSLFVFFLSFFLSIWNVRFSFNKNKSFKKKKSKNKFIRFVKVFIVANNPMIFNLLMLQQFQSHHIDFVFTFSHPIFIRFSCSMLQIWFCFFLLRKLFDGKWLWFSLEKKEMHKTKTFIWFFFLIEILIKIDDPTEGQLENFFNFNAQIVQSEATKLNGSNLKYEKKQRTKSIALTEMKWNAVQTKWYGCG